jgi:formylglycine-generating enzyme required for sulfatase activity
MDKYLVTKASWDDVRTWATAHGYRFDGELYDEGPHGQGKGPDHPVRTVNWYDCVKWCNARSEREGRPICYRVRATPYRSGNTTEVECDFNVEGYRLPTDAEWEYAARGGLVGQRYPWGNTIDHTRANYWSWWTGLYHPDPYCDYDNGYAGNDVRYNDGVQPYTSPVGAFAANDYGLSDMVGNMWQWCWDWHPGAYGLRRVKRGGAWDTPAHACRIGVRASSYPDLWHEEYVTYGDTGFRTVLTRGQ